MVAPLIIPIIIAASAVAGMAADMWQAAKQKEDIQAALNEVVAQQQEEERKRQEEAAAAGAGGAATEKKEAGNLGIIAAIIGIVVLIAILYSFSE